MSPGGGGAARIAVLEEELRLAREAAGAWRLRCQQAILALQVLLRCVSWPGVTAALAPALHLIRVIVSGAGEMPPVCVACEGHQRFEAPGPKPGTMIETACVCTAWEWPRRMRICPGCRGTAVGPDTCAACQQALPCPTCHGKREVA